ncbi:MAG TPA: hypothetical protein VEU30_03970, partial [Thermoanaerobaculia bacterium]|nr:hypothetical protein [Thermoanaerobaculia bacterium]
ARLIGLFPAIELLPKLFYFVNLLLFYRLTNLLAVRMNRADLAEAAFTPGHLLVILLGCNGFFFGVTVQPYTDALAYALMFAALLVLDRGVAREGAASPMLAGAAGVLAGLALLTRTQSIILILAIAMALVWLVACDRRLLAFAAAFVVTCGTLVAVWYFGFHKIAPGPRAAIAYDRLWIQPAGTGEWLRHRVEGLVTSLNPSSAHSYFRSVGIAMVLPLLAAPLALRRWLREKPFCAAPASLLPLTTTLAGLGFFFVLNFYHHRPGFFVPWLFGHRHGLPVIFLIAVAAIYLLGAGKPIRIATMAIVVVTAALGFTAILDYVTQPRPSSPTPAETALATWVEQQPKTPVLLTARAQHLSVYTRANLHWTLCETPAAKTREMLEKLPIDYVVVYAHERQCAFVDGLGRELVETARFGEGPRMLYLLGRRPGSRR